MIKCHLGVISSKGLDLQYVYMAFDFHDVTTLAKICAFSFVSLSGALLLFVIALVDLDDAVYLWYFLPVREGGLAVCSSTPSSAHSISTRNDRGLEGSVLPSVNQPWSN